MLGAGLWVLLPQFWTGGQAEQGVGGRRERNRPRAAEAPAPATEPRQAGGLTASGYVVARRKATVAAEITGKVVELLVEEGMVVRAGQVVARLDSVLAETDLDLAQSRATAAEAAAPPSLPTCGTPNASWTGCSLSQKSIASEADLTKAEARVGILRAQLRSGRRRNSQTARLDVQRNATVLDKHKIRAPFGGIVVERSAQPGEMISPMSAGGGFTRTGICTIVDMDSIEIEVDVNEAFIGRVRAGGAIAAVLDAYPDWTIPAAVIAIVPTANREKATVKVRIGLKQKDPRVLPDMAVKVQIPRRGHAAVAPTAEAVAAMKQAATYFQRENEVDVQAPLVRLAGVGKGFVKGKETISIFDHLDLTIPAGDFVAVMGPSGSGKTTLLNLLGGIDRPDAGEIHVAGERIDGLSEGELARWRAANIGFIFQFYNLMPMLTAAQNVELPLLLTKLGKPQRRQHVETALKIVSLADRAKHYPREMSGGQQQRVAIARAIVSDPKLLLCDEPTGDLDRTTADEILSTLQMLNRELGKTIVMVTHDPAAARYARRTLHLDKGRFVEKELAA